MNYTTDRSGHPKTTARPFNPKNQNGNPQPFDNQILAALSSAELESLADDLEPVTLALGDMIYEPDQKISHAIFPTSAVVSLHYVTFDGATAEFACVGREGMVGIAIVMGGTMPSSAVVKQAGHAFRLDRHLLEAAFERNGTMQSALLRYTQALLAQSAQSAACNRHHSIEQQLCRYLLHALDRITGRELVMTQELIGNMLGVRREGVTSAAGKLQQSGLIHYRRGHITVLDRKGLESCACECYKVVKNETDRLFSSGQNGNDLLNGNI